MQRKKLKKEKRKNKFFLLIFALIVLLSACGKEETKPIKVIVKKFHKKKVLKKKIKMDNYTQKLKKKFVFNPLEIKRNPFKAFIKEKPVEIPILPEELTVTPLTEYSIDQYKLVGIMTDTRPPLAMVETSDKKGLIFTIGDYIGSEYYKVVKINTKEIILEKKFLTEKKKIKVEQKILKIDISGE